MARRSRLTPAVLRLVLLGGVLLLSLFGAGAAVISFLLLREGYGFVVWALPLLALVVLALVFGVVVWRLTRGDTPSTRHAGGSEERPRRGRPRGGDNV